MEINLTENSYIYQGAKRLAERELNKAIKLLLDNENKWNETLDLKLHDIAYGFNCDFELNGATVHFDDDARERWFTDFCEIEYDYFNEWLKENNIGSILDYVGHTSQFYIGNLHADNLLDTLYEASDEFKSQDFFGYTEDKDGVLHIDSTGYDDIEQEVNDLLAFAENIYSEVEDSLKNIIKVYDYITSFKENQVTNFMEFVEDSWKCGI